MKYIYILFLFFTFNVTSQVKDFEGYVIYKVIMKNPNPKIISDSLWNARVPKKEFIHKYFYKKNKYKNIISGEGVQLYSPTEDKIHVFKIEKDTVFSNSITTSKSIDPVISIKKLEGKETILDIKCNILVIKSKLSKSTYYYSSKLRIPYKNFENHKYGNWSQYLEVTNSLPLKIISKSPFYFMEMTAIEIKEMKLKGSIFKVSTIN